MIFVALAVAWAVYLIPKALKHHDEVVRSRSVDRFSHTMRVLARREPVDRRNARLVVTPGRAASAAGRDHEAAARRTDATVPAAAPPPTPARARAAANRAAAPPPPRARRASLLATLVVVGAGRVRRHRLGVRRGPGRPARRLAGRLPADGRSSERTRPRPAPGAARRRRPASRRAAGRRPPDRRAEPPRPTRSPSRRASTSSRTPPRCRPCRCRPSTPTLWDPLPVTLPTYVTKPAAARRTVRTIDLDDTGVWTSGRTEADAAIAREAARRRPAERTRRDDAAGPAAPSAPDRPADSGRPADRVLTFRTASLGDALGLWRSW